MDRLKAKYNKNPLKTDVYKLSGLKLVLDDLVQEFLAHVKKSRQSKTSTDVKIAVGLVSSAIAVAVGLISVRLDFATHKQLLTALIGAYFVLNILAEIYFWHAGTSFVFSDRVVSTKINSPDPAYNVLVYNRGKLIPRKYTKSVFDLFDSDGTLIHEEFIDDLERLFEE